MKRFHVHVGVADLETSIAFYSGLFGTAPSVTRADYAKWMLDGAAKGIEHVGLQVDSAEELAEVQGCLRAAGRPVLDEGATTCCYAESEKSWIADPDGVVWEAFHTTGEVTDYGTSPDLGALASANAAANACCAPVLAEKPKSCC